MKNRFVNFINNKKLYSLVVFVVLFGVKTRAQSSNHNISKADSILFAKEFAGMDLKRANDTIHKYFISFDLFDYSIGKDFLLNAIAVKYKQMDSISNIVGDNIKESGDKNVITGTKITNIVSVNEKYLQLLGEINYLQDILSKEHFRYYSLARSKSIKNR